ncbi:MAG: hypothetical protein IPO58_24745 [Betaproteobacteria bacterium]|nr:hypothetical protein [Betaproteobacteria bacterium]
MIGSFCQPCGSITQPATMATGGTPGQERIRVTVQTALRAWVSNGIVRPSNCTGMAASAWIARLRRQLGPPATARGRRAPRAPSRRRDRHAWRLARRPRGLRRRLAVLQEAGDQHHDHAEDQQVVAEEHDVLPGSLRHREDRHLAPPSDLVARLEEGASRRARRPVHLDHPGLLAAGRVDHDPAAEHRRALRARDRVDLERVQAHPERHRSW